MRKLLGYQIADANGSSIAGDDSDPFDTASFEILVEDAAETARKWVNENPGFRLIEIREGDIEEPEFQGFVKLRTDR